MDYIISECEQNDLLYAYYKKEFWFWDEHQNKWVVSDFARARFEKALQTSPKLNPEDFMTNGDEFWELDEWEVSTEQINALELVKVERKSTESDRELIKEGTDARRQVHSRARIECGSISAVHVCDKKPDDVKIWLNAMAPAEYWVLNSGDDPCGEHIEVCPYCGVNLKDGAGDVMIVPFPHAAQSQQNCENAAEVQQAGSEEDASISASIGNTLLVGNALESFDFSGLGELAGQAAEADEQFNLHYGKAQDEYLVSCIYLARIHELTAKAGRYGGGTWTAWYQSKGISEGSARTMVQNGDGFKSASVADLKNLPVLTKKDLNLIARNGVANQVVEAAGEGDSDRIQDILNQLKAVQTERDEARKAKEKAEQERDAARDAQANLSAMANKFSKQRDAAEQRVEDAERRAQAAEEDAAGWKQAGLEMQELVDQRDERIRELESGITVEAAAVDQEEIERRANEITEPLAKIIDQQGKEIKRLASGSTVSAQASVLNQYLQTMIVSLLGNAHRSELTSYDIGALDRLARTLQDFADAIENLFNESEDDQDGE